MAREKIIKCQVCRRAVTRNRWLMLEHLIVYHFGELVSNPARLAALATLGANNHEAFKRELAGVMARRAINKVFYGR
jgi:hypothetical protein